MLLLLSPRGHTLIVMGKTHGIPIVIIPIARNAGDGDCYCGVRPPFGDEISSFTTHHIHAHPNLCTSSANRLPRQPHQN